MTDTPPGTRSLEEIPFTAACVLGAGQPRRTLLCNLDGITHDADTVRAHNDNIELAWHSASTDDGLKLQLSLTNRGDEPLHVHALLPFVLTESLRWSQRSPCTFFRLGYQSWSPTGALLATEAEVRGRFGLVRDMSENSEPLSLRGKGHLVANWLGLLSGDERHLILSTVTSHRAITQVELSATPDGCGAEQLAVSCCYDGIPLPPGETLTSEWIWVAAGDDPNRLFTTAADLWGAAMKARTEARATPGWCTWYRFQTRIDEKLVERSLNAVQQHQPTLPIGLFQIDDGYQPSMGEWIESSPDYGDIRESIAGVTRAGLKAGIWLAPFVTQQGSPLAKAHPEWLLKNEKGKPRIAGINPFWGGRYYALDCTHPEVLDEVRQWFSTFVEWGVTFFKIDFAFAAALPGVRHDPKTTRADALRRGLTAIREAVGDDVYLLGCGMPFGPAVGLVDGMRVGPDVDRFWQRRLFLWGLGSPVFPSAANGVLATLNRWFLHRRLWENDPDCGVVFDSPNNKLSLAETHTVLSTIGLTGGVTIASEDLDEVGDAGRRQLAALVPPHPHQPRALDFGAPAPATYVVEAKPGGNAVVYLFNWAKQTSSVTLARREMGEGAYHRFDPWAERYLGVWTEGDLRVSGVAPRGCQVEILTPRKDRPQVVGYSPALAGLVDGSLVESFDEAAGTLTVNLTVPDGRVVNLWLLAPKGFAAGEPEIENGTLRSQAQDGAVGMIELLSHGNPILTLRHSR